MLKELDIPVRKYKTDDGHLWAQGARSLDSFDSRAFDSSEGFCKWWTETRAVSTEVRMRISELIGEVANIKVSLDVSSEQIKRAQSSIIKLQNGEDLTSEEALHLSKMVQFIQSIMDWHNRDDIIIDRARVIERLQKNSIVSAGEDADEIIDDALEDILDRTYAAKGQKLEFEMRGSDTSVFSNVSSTKEERVLAGLYLADLFLLAKGLSLQGWQNVTSKIDIIPSLSSNPQKDC